MESSKWLPQVQLWWPGYMVRSTSSEFFPSNTNGTIHGPTIPQSNRQPNGKLWARCGMEPVAPALQQKSQAYESSGWFFSLAVHSGNTYKHDMSNSSRAREPWGLLYDCWSAHSRAGGRGTVKSVWPPNSKACDPKDACSSVFIFFSISLSFCFQSWSDSQSSWHSVLVVYSQDGTQFWIQLGWDKIWSGFGEIFAGLDSEICWDEVSITQTHFVAIQPLYGTGFGLDTDLLKLIFLCLVQPEIWCFIIGFRQNFVRVKLVWFGILLDFFWDTVTKSQNIVSIQSVLDKILLHYNWVQYFFKFLHCPFSLSLSLCWRLRLFPWEPSSQARCSSSVSPLKMRHSSASSGL